MRRVVQRAGLVVAVAAVTVLCVSSAWLAAGLVVAGAVAVDMVFARARPQIVSRPERLSVDLTRRR